MIRIEEFKVKNYKNIGEADLKLSNFNLIVGANNSGKTNFIQILSFLDFLINGEIDSVEKMIKDSVVYRFASASTEFGIVYPKFTRINTTNTEFYLKFFNSKSKTIYQYFISIKWNKEKDGVTISKGKIEKEYLTKKNIHKTGKAVTIFDRNNDKISGLGKTINKVSDNLQSHVSYVRILKLIPGLLPTEYSDSIEALESILKTPVFYFSSIELSKKIDRTDNYGVRTIAFDLSNQIVEIQENKTDWAFFERVLNDLLGIIEVRVKLEYFIDGVDERDKTSLPMKFTHKTENTILFKHNEEGDFKHFYELSDGSLLLIALLTKILTSKHDIFLIEEPENSLHPTALLGLLDVMASFYKEKQFIITTHSETLVSRTKPEEVMVAKIGDNGMSEITNIQNIRELKRKLRNDFINFSDYVFFGEDETFEVEY